jgi:pimeloyl-ACP methyl ester carboxylesterase
MRIDVNGTGISLTDTGEGPAVLLLHGWPDTHHMWRHQIPVLVEAGYRVVAPDLRGFGDSDKPEAIAAYGMLDLAGDVLGTLDHRGIDRAHLVGHDWGAALAWVLAAVQPDRVTSLAALSVGHPSAFVAAGLAQREKSWYMLLFQFEAVAEQWLSADGFRNLAEWSHHPDLDEVAARLVVPAALSASLAVYRANMPAEALIAPRLELPPIQCPTLGVWSSGDMALTEAQMAGSADFVKGRWRYERVDGVGHWIPLEAPETVNRLVQEHLSDT